MNVATDISGAYLFAYLKTADLVAATSIMAREATIAEDDVKRSYMDVPSWDDIAADVRITRRTAVSEKAPILVGERHADNEVLDEVVSYGDLLEGWDGDQAAKPNADAIYDAVRFIRAVSRLELEITPTLHVDGSVILEVGDENSIRFLGNGKTAYVSNDAGFGKADFDGFAVPDEIKHALHI